MARLPAPAVRHDPTPAGCHIVADLTRPESAIRQQQVVLTYTGTAEAIDCTGKRSAPQRVAEGRRKVPLYTGQTRRASQVWSKEMRP
jgi:hypothetical protein